MRGLVGLAQGQSRVLVETKKELTQVYLCLARPALVYSDPRRSALPVLNMSLGGGVSSSLPQRLREREALVYSVGSLAEQYSDSGVARCVSGDRPPEAGSVHGGAARGVRPVERT